MSIKLIKEFRIISSNSLQIDLSRLCAHIFSRKSLSETRQLMLTPHQATISIYLSAKVMFQFHLSKEFSINSPKNFLQ